jgi:hypothetical protein
MPRYFFCLQDRQTEFRDDEGEDFPGIVEAEEHASQVAQELAQNQSSWELRDCFIAVKDIHGAELARVVLGKADDLTSLQSRTFGCESEVDDGD